MPTIIDELIKCSKQQHSLSGYCIASIIRNIYTYNDIVKLSHILGGIQLQLITRLTDIKRYGVSSRGIMELLDYEQCDMSACEARKWVDEQYDKIWRVIEVPKLYTISQSEDTSVPNALCIKKYVTLKGRQVLLMMVHMQDGLYNGHYKKWFFLGEQLESEGDYMNGKLTGHWRFFRNGHLQYDCGYVNGKRTGHSRLFHDNGRLWMEGNYVDDKRIGRWQFFDRYGESQGDANY